jgi:hypothetical protein
MPQDFMRLTMFRRYSLLKSTFYVNFQALLFYYFSHSPSFLCGCISLQHILMLLLHDVLSCNTTNHKQMDNPTENRHDAGPVLLYKARLKQVGINPFPKINLPVREHSSGNMQSGPSCPRLLSLAFGILSKRGCFKSFISML